MIATTNVKLTDFVIYGTIMQLWKTKNYYFQELCESNTKIKNSITTNSNPKNNNKAPLKVYKYS